MTTSKAPFDFFRDNAGYSYDPKTETPEVGRDRTAEQLTVAESFAYAAGWSCDWTIDPEADSSEFSDDPDPWRLWAAVLRDRNGNTLASLCGVDFGRGGDPHRDDHARVVSAELSAEAMSNVECPMRFDDRSSIGRRDVCEWIESQNRDFMKPYVAWFDTREAAECVAVDSDADDPEPGYYARLSAPGYLDATDWAGPYSSIASAVFDLYETFAE